MDDVEVGRFGVDEDPLRAGRTLVTVLWTAVGLLAAVTLAVLRPSTAPLFLGALFGFLTWLAIRIGLDAGGTGI